ncbi:MAG: TonB-dependent receptor [Chitinophagaceae bacterium]|nr:MAG: TonB-dependent receptor [Chitinophagaceae bacterium]
MKQKILLLVTLVVIHSALHAQSPPGNYADSLRSDTLREVVVANNHYADRRKEESLNIEAVSETFIRRHLGGSLMKTLERLPGIKTIGIGSGQSKPLIRGLGFNRVVVADKGLKHEGQQWGADHGLEIDQFAAGEVELVKGAASFLYGSDAIAGVINIKPTAIPAAKSLGGSVDLMGKTNNRLFGTSASIYGRNQHWFFDARYTFQDYADYRVPAGKVYVYDYAVNLHNNQLRNTAGREHAAHFSTGYINDRFRNILYLSNVFSRSGFFANAHGLEPRQVDEQTHDASPRDILLPQQQVNHLKLINRSVYKTGNHQLEADLGFQRNHRREFSQYVNHGYMPAVFPGSLSISNDLEREFDKQVYSVNLRDILKLGQHFLKTGINAEYQDNTIGGWTFLVPSFRQYNIGAFIYDRYELNEKIFLHAALRYDYAQIRLFAYRDWFPSGQTPAQQYLARAPDLTRTFNSIVWSTGINYNNGPFELKANLGKAFRMPIAKELGANGVNYHYFSYEKGDASLSAEQSYQADLSLSWKAAVWSVTLSPFYNYFPNYISLNPTADHDYFYGAGNQVFEYTQSRVGRYGGEMLFTYEWTPALYSSVLGEYLYAEQLSGNKQGYTLPFSPPASVLFNLTWSPATKGKLNKPYLSVDYRVTSSQNKIVPPEKKTPGYQLINIQMGTGMKLKSQPLLISLQAQNLLNTRYLNHTSFYRLIELPEAGRNIILSLKIPFRIKTAQEPG